MQRPTEIDLARTGFAEGATVTPEVAAAVRELLEQKDAALHAIADSEVDAQARLQALAHIALNIHGLEVPEPECAYSLDKLEATVRALRQRSDVLCWMEGFPMGAVHGAGVVLRPTEEQSAAMGDEETPAGAIAMATTQVNQAVAEYNALRAKNRAERVTFTE